jgi:hypothetical protein
MSNTIDWLESQPEFPPVPPQSQWDFFLKPCPEDERFTRLKYELHRRAYYEDPSFADRLPTAWRTKYPQWCDTPYLDIPEEGRRQAGLQKTMADAMLARSIPEEAYEVFRLCDAIGEPLAYEHKDGIDIVLRVHRGMSLEALIEHLEAYAREYHGAKALTERPEGGGSYARQLQADLNALTAYILLQTLTPAEATAITGELLADKTSPKLGLYSKDQAWKKAADRGKYLVKQTLEGKLDAVLVLEQVSKILSA